MMEMHDGMGSKLVGLISQIDSKESVDLQDLKSDLRETLDDLRMVVDSINPVDNDLVTVLANYRGRLEKTLKGSRFKLSWDIEDLPPVSNLDLHASLNILRIIQEACTNVLKYSCGTHITISAKESVSGEVLITIHDNGSGFLESDVGSGRGLENMSKRADQLGGKLTIVSNCCGVSIILSLRTVAEAKPSSSNAH